MNRPIMNNEITDKNRRGFDKMYTLLCIDDESANLKILASIFKDHYKVVVCKSAAQGFIKALEIVPDLILLDVLMPNESGFELISQLKSKSETSHIPVIFITGLQSADDEERGLTLGACDYIQKPFSYGIVRARVNTQLELIRQRKLLEKFANFDSLTELPNRRKWQTDSIEQWELAKESHQAIVLGIIDIDFFKQFNDCYGHIQGDIALRKISNAINRVLFGHLGKVYRCGGEEFYFYLPANNKNDIRSILAECLECVSELEIKHESSEVSAHTSISIGAIQVFPANDIPLNHIMSLADEQLYQVKNTSRNAVHFDIYSPEKISK